MRALIISLLSIILAAGILPACKKKNEPRLSGIDTIDNVLYGSQVYYALGFSFELGELTSTLELPAPDITVHVLRDNGNNIIGKYLDTPNQVESFAFAGQYSSRAEAETAFDQLIDVGTRNWQLSAMDLEEHQIWLFKTSEGNYVKFRITKIVTDNLQRPPFIETTFEWRIQPDGATSFSK